MMIDWYILNEWFIYLREIYSNWILTFLKSYNCKIMIYFKYLTITRLVKEYKCNPIIIQNNQGFFKSN